MLSANGQPARKSARIEIIFNMKCEQSVLLVRTYTVVITKEVLLKCAKAFYAGNLKDKKDLNVNELKLWTAILSKTS